MQRLDVNPTYSNIVIYNNTVYLSGQVPWHSAGSDITSQVKEVFELVNINLIKAGSNKCKIISMQIFLKRPEDYKAMNEVFTLWIPEGCAPARNTICGVSFPNPKWDIEVVVVAAA